MNPINTTVQLQPSVGYDELRSELKSGDTIMSLTDLFDEPRGGAGKNFVGTERTFNCLQRPAWLDDDRAFVIFGRPVDDRLDDVFTAEINFDKKTITAHLVRRNVPISDVDVFVEYAMRVLGDSA